MAMERTNAGDNKFVNNKDFGMIAQSAQSRGSKTTTQVGNDNQREAYNSNRDRNQPEVARWAPIKIKILGSNGDKVSRSQSGQKMPGETPVYGQHKEVTKDRNTRNKQRAGGQGK